MTSSSSKAIQKLTDRFNSSACESLEAIEFFKNRNNATPHDEDEGTRMGEVGWGEGEGVKGVLYDEGGEGTTSDTLVVKANLF